MKKFDAVFFDVDSTLVKIEGLDWIASYKEKGGEIQELTKKSMEGRMGFNEAMVKKMRILAPSLEEMRMLGRIYCQHLVDGVEHVVSLLHALGKEVWILSGNFRPAVEILAEKLGIPDDRIICNNIFFNAHGAYCGFDVENDLTHNNGKARVMKRICRKNKHRTVFVGDGVTDLEAKDCVALFVGFGGVVERKIVKEKADVYISTPSLYPLLDHILNEDEKRKLSSIQYIKNYAV